jgi:toluene monooxygenase system ferredoxin subunit
MAELPLSVDELWVGEMRGVVLGQQKLLVVRTEQAVCVYRDRCPHQGYPLSEGRLENGVITCPLHGHTFDAATGAGINPPAPRLVSLPARSEQGQLLVELA